MLEVIGRKLPGASRRRRAGGLLRLKATGGKDDPRALLVRQSVWPEVLPGGRQKLLLPVLGNLVSCSAWPVARQGVRHPASG